MRGDGLQEKSAKKAQNCIDQLIKIIKVITSIAKIRQKDKAHVAIQKQKLIHAGFCSVSCVL